MLLQRFSTILCHRCFPRLSSALNRLIMDKKTRQRCKVKIGLDEFIDMAFSNKKVDVKMICPCKECGEESSVSIKVAKDHLKYVGSSVGYAKIVSSAIASVISSESQTSDGNPMNVMDENLDIKLFRDFVERSMQLGVEGKELNDSIANYYSLKHRKKRSDKSVSMLLELSKEVSEECADPSMSSSVSEMVPLLEEEEEEDNTAYGEKRNQPSASTSSGSTGYSPREENRRKLREKINQRKVSRYPSVR